MKKEPIKIVVEGMRGKSNLVLALHEILRNRNYSVLSKTTGIRPIIIENGKQKIIKRAHNHRFFIDEENKKCLKLKKGKDFIIFENQAITSYSMKIFHKILKTDILLIPNIREEHQEDLGENIREIATSFAVHFNTPNIIITAEQKEEVLRIFRKYTKKFKKKLIEIKFKEEIPSIGNIYLIDKTLKLLTGEGLTKEEIKFYKDKTESRFNIKHNGYNLKYFIGSKINDIESSLNAYKHLTKRYPKENFCYVGYLRRDRIDRTKSFVKFFNEIGTRDNVKRIFLAGHYCSYIHDRLNPVAKRKTFFTEQKDQDKITQFCLKNNLVLTTAVNGVNEYMRVLEKRISH